LQVIEAQERHEKSPKKVTSHKARCGSLGVLLIYQILKIPTFLCPLKTIYTRNIKPKTLICFQINKFCEAQARVRQGQAKDGP